MKYSDSFLTTLKISRYLFRVLVLLLWLLIALFCGFYVINALRKEESEIRISFNLNYDQAQRYMQHTVDLLKEIKYVTEDRLSSTQLNPAATPPAIIHTPNNKPFDSSHLLPLEAGANCKVLSGHWQMRLQSVVKALHNWRDKFFTNYDMQHLFLLDIADLCMVDFAVTDSGSGLERVISALRERMSKYRNQPQSERGNSLFWMRSGNRQNTGYFYLLTPVWLVNRSHLMLGLEQTIRSENLLAQGGLPADITILDNNGHVLLSFSEQKNHLTGDPRWLSSRSWFGYSKNFQHIMLKKTLSPSNLSIIYSLPVAVLLDHIKVLAINMLLANILLAVVLFILARMFERRLFIPAENDAQRLEENEQFNRKIVAYAPVGICILRVIDGANILSNELAHNYLNMLTYEDKQRLNQVVRSQQINLVDVLTSNNTHLQISFVHSRYRNENVAICVLVDVSERVKMEQSLQEIAKAAEQASQAKSMFLATVSHELRTPLYGIIGNLDLLHSKALPEDVDRLVTAMSNSSSLLLKIISDILDFSKIESEQLKIEAVDFSPREMISHITANYLPLVVRKQLALYCLIEPEVPLSLSGDAMRLQQVISNLLSNAIKFTDLGCIILHVYREADYLIFLVRDTGSGVDNKELIRLFEPFFQAANHSSSLQNSFPGTGLGLPICEKLINLMDGDIAVKTEPGIGSEFSIRIPLFPQPPALPVATAPVDISMTEQSATETSEADTMQPASLPVNHVLQNHDSQNHALTNHVLTNHALINHTLINKHTPSNNRQPASAAANCSKLPELCCWLAVRNQLLLRYLQHLLSWHGLQVQQLPLSAQAQAAVKPEDILITDLPDKADKTQATDQPLYQQGRQIRFCPQHIGAPIAAPMDNNSQAPQSSHHQTNNHNWIISTAAPHEIIGLIQAIASGVPQSVASQPSSASAAQRLAQSDNSDMLILLADDHPINRQLLADQLTLLGYRSLTATDGLDALKMLEKHPVDILLTDVNMPNMDGYSLTRQLRQQQWQLPIIGFTANALAEEKQRCLAAGMNDCLAKPVTLSQIQQMLTSYVVKIRQSRAERSASPSSGAIEL